MMIGSTASGCDALRVLVAMLLSAEKLVGLEDSKVLQGLAMAARKVVDFRV